jgi:hypothetical protein
MIRHALDNFFCNVDATPICDLLFLISYNLSCTKSVNWTIYKSESTANINLEFVSCLRFFLFGDGYCLFQSDFQCDATTEKRKQKVNH